MECQVLFPFLYFPLMNILHTQQHLALLHKLVRRIEIIGLSPNILKNVQ